MTPVPSSNHQEQLSMLASLTTKSMPQHEKNLKRPAPIMIPAVAKKRRGLVSRTHSPKRQVNGIGLCRVSYTRVSCVPVPVSDIFSFPLTHLVYLFWQVSPVSTPFLTTPALTPQLTLSRQIKCEVRKLAPTVKGVTEAAKLICNGESVVVPTETVYMSCASIASLGDSSKPFLNSSAAGKSSVIRIFTRSARKWLICSLSDVAFSSSSSSRERRC